MKTICKLRKKITSLLQCESGLAFIEFALSIGIFLILFFGSVEVSRYILVARKLQDASNEETNMLTSLTATTLAAGEMNAILSAAGIIMKPYAAGGAAGLGSNGYVIITDIMNTGSGAKVQWKYCGGGSFTSVSSKFGGTGSNETTHLKTVFPNKTFALNNGDEIIVAEVFFKYTPIINNGITKLIVPSKHTFYNAAVSVPRTVSLKALIASNCT